MKFKSQHSYNLYPKVQYLKKQHAYNLYTKVQYLEALKTDDPLHIFTDFSSVNIWNYYLTKPVNTCIP